jgi:hypothetical protein
MIVDKAGKDFVDHTIRQHAVQALSSSLLEIVNAALNEVTLAIPLRLPV